VDVDMVRGIYNSETVSGVFLGYVNRRRNEGRKA
jgi:hypothetical protein